MSSTKGSQHKPVLLKETIELLDIRPGGIYVDCTVGLGGHSDKILEALGPAGRLIGIDRDPSALEVAGERLAHVADNFDLFNDNFKNLPLLCKRLKIDRIAGCIVDLGVSSLQLDSPERGFSFQHEGPLDMRMDPRLVLTAAQIVNGLEEDRLAGIFREYGEERQARRIAAEVVRRRQIRPFRTTTELAEVVESVKGRPPSSRIHPATQVFQALRIEVNQELTGLQQFIEQVVDLLAAEGRLVVIAFHSLEDRVVKRTFRQLAGRCICMRPSPVCRCPKVKRVEILTPRPLVPGERELQDNPRSRSAKLRAVESVGEP